jgi:hypothetical protein
MNETKAKPVQFPYCNACGSAGVISDASARWCMSAQDWDLSGVQDYECCDACGGEDIAWASVPTENLAECQDCGEAWHIDHVKEAQDLAQRVSPGEIVPAGECPSCGALCHLWEAPKPKVSQALTFETESGNWFEYGRDGRATTNESDAFGRDIIDAGFGWRARIMPNIHGGDYGWGPQAQTEAEAIKIAKSERVETLVCAEPGPALDASAEAETAYSENRDNDELQIDRTNPAAVIMHDAVWVRSWTRVRSIGEGAQ